jgi:hypothetical protein
VSVVGDPRDKATTTLVGFHDLLGFGDLLASSGGTLDSAVGEIAYGRILALRRSLHSVRHHFPPGSTIFHFNDSAAAVLDVSVDIGSSHTDPSGIGSLPLDRDPCMDVLRFVGACASLHQSVIREEEEGRLGPAGRTFVNLGKRWKIEEDVAPEITEISDLQANLSFAEAYIANSLGSAKGFGNRSYANLYINDFLWHVLNSSRITLSPGQLESLSLLGSKDRRFPDNLLSIDVSPIRVRIFHRQRTFYSLMSHHTCDIVNLVKP